MLEYHFSHDHPLVFFNEWDSKDSEHKLCYACQKTISGTSIYSSLHQNFFLHQKCAELPREITHPMHPDHKLTLVAKPPYENSTCVCNVCRKEWKWFTYHCFLCNEFDIRVTCIMEEPTIQLNGHHHPLTLKMRPAFFHCDACDSKGEDFPYICSTCPTWFHKNCASSPATVKFDGHDHLLELAYSLMPINSNFMAVCKICKEVIHTTNWVYHCAECKYFVHLNCPTSNGMSP